MSIKDVIGSLEGLVYLHHELLDVSKKKTEVIKEGNVDELQQILVRERKLVRKVEAAEKRRMELVDGWLQTQNFTASDATLTTILEQLTNGNERSALEKVTIELTKAITDLKAQEKLNLALINQSMQFVQVSLDLLSPTLKNMNYTNNNRPNAETPNRSIFDSKA